ncbi:Probable acetyltransferase, GNAT family [Flavobacterium indicum GPTSA100-9 = DSM 17447]|uniref:Probable acetyltransferase, GNAT family n=1 Tax=Flavobacterium indicum (strain DSM 17447 / CIP 109464 / GPTSA100-9) TaxID=1094466 RepID=H8XR90_FLAIG|nr:GNAT family N-acetyltransferase [Flavobacterium indicum]CCG54324.1 Probable acetyltransferase, GNAT family [Flavobacterium indicum GPTSA100-9 = DSM 17447]
MKVIKTNSDHPDFKKLSTLFDEYLVDIDGDEREFFAHYNNVQLDHVLVVYYEERAVGCGAFKKYEEDTAEIKRMFVLPEARGKGIANMILTEIQSWAIEQGFAHFILETSPKLHHAIALYTKMGYQFIPNYGQYIGVENSVCMKK